MTEDKILKICDFGLCRDIPENNEKDPKKKKASFSPVVVTLQYRCPELLLGYEQYDYNLDMWSCGCILYELVKRSRLIESQNEFPAVCEIFEILGSCSKETWDEFENLPYAKMWNFAKR
eukprot:UN31908